MEIHGSRRKGMYEGANRLFLLDFSRSSFLSFILSLAHLQLAAATDRYGSKPFLNLFVVRHHAFSRDVVLRRVHLEVDTLEVEIDADMLNGLNVRKSKKHRKLFIYCCRIDQKTVGRRRGRRCVLSVDTACEFRLAEYGNDTPVLPRTI